MKTQMEYIERREQAYIWLMGWLCQGPQRVIGHTKSGTWMAEDVPANKRYESLTARNLAEEIGGNAQ